MRRPFPLVLLLSFVPAFAFAVFAQEPRQQPPAVPGQQPQTPQQPRPNTEMPQNPRIGPEHRRLAMFLGAWEEKVNYPNESEKDGTGRWFARPALGLFVMMNYEGEGPQGRYRAVGMLTWDHEEQNYRLWWFDDAGGVGEYRGAFSNEGTLALEHRGKVEGRDFRERITYTRSSPTELKTKIEQAWGGGEFRTYLDAVATRTGDAPPPGQQPGQSPRRPMPERPPN